jgi:hypothetical protein
MTIKGKKLAMTMNGADQVLMQPEDKGGWISDSYVAVKLNNYEYHEFIFRFFNYKKYNKVEHFECEEGETLTIRKDGDKTWSDKTERKVIDSLLIDIPIEKNVEVTDILFKDRENGRILRILRKDDYLLYINDNEYGWILDELDGYDINQTGGEGRTRSINIIDGKGNPIALLMPIFSKEIGKKVRKELEEDKRFKVKKI